SISLILIMPTWPPGMSKVGNCGPASATWISMSLSLSSLALSRLRNASRVAAEALVPTRASSTRSSAFLSACALTSLRPVSRVLVMPTSTRSRTMESTSRPTYPTSVNLVASTLRKGAPASLASRREISVLPQPVGPIMRMFLGSTSSLSSVGSCWRRQRLRSAMATARLASFWPTMKRSSSETISRGEKLVMVGLWARWDRWKVVGDRGRDERQEQPPQRHPAGAQRYHKCAQNDERGGHRKRAASAPIGQRKAEGPAEVGEAGDEQGAAVDEDGHDRQSRHRQNHGQRKGRVHLRVGGEMPAVEWSGDQRH